MYQITDDQFDKAQRIIDEYHRERQQQADSDLDDDEEYDPDDDDFDEQDTRYYCKCGAWEINPTTGKLVHCADCICGAE
jgi:hypothetical protein